MNCLGLTTNSVFVKIVWTLWRIYSMEFRLLGSCKVKVPGQSNNGLLSIKSHIVCTFKNTFCTLKKLLSIKSYCVHLKKNLIQRYVAGL